MSFIIPMLIWIFVSWQKLCLLFYFGSLQLISYSFPPPPLSTASWAEHTPSCQQLESATEELGLQAWCAWALGLEPAEKKGPCYFLSFKGSEIRSPLRRRLKEYEILMRLQFPTNLHITNNQRNIQQIVSVCACNYDHTCMKVTHV